MERDRLGIGIIGYGGFGQFLHRSWSSMDDVVVRAIADGNPDLAGIAGENARRCADVVGAVDASSSYSSEALMVPSDAAPHRSDAPIFRFYDDWRPLLNDPEVDVVSIVTPPFTHADIACAAMQAGKHVLIEKPLATTLKDAQRILAAAEQTGRVAAIDYMLRFNPLVELLQRWAYSGSFGALRRVVVENYAQDESLSPDHWFWDPSQSGGILIEHAVHFIDVVNGCTDADIASAEGFSVQRNDGRIDRMGLTAVYADGLVNQQYHSFSRPGFFEETGIRFVFDLAQVDLNGWIPLGGTINALVNAETLARVEELPGFNIVERRPLGGDSDASQPQVSGTAEESALAAQEGGNIASNDLSNTVMLRSGGIAYEVTEQVHGRFSLPTSKSEAYASALCALMADVVAAIRDPHHRLRAGLPEAVRSLEVAVSATEHASERLKSGTGAPGRA